MVSLNTYMLIGSGSKIQNNQIVNGDGTIETQEYFDINISENLDNIATSITFSLPQIEKFENLSRLDPIKFYAKITDTRMDNPADLINDSSALVFNGYINTINEAEAKTDLPKNITGLTTMGLTNEYPAIIESIVGENIVNIFVFNLEQSGLTSRLEPTEGIIPFNTIIPEEGIETQSLGASVTGGRTSKEVVDQIKTKYAYKIYQIGNGLIFITNPTILIANNKTAIVWDIKKEDYISIDYGDVTNDKEGVIVIGQGVSFGVAVDLGAVQNKEKFDADGNPTPSYEIFLRRDILGSEACDEVARNILLDMLKNNILTLQIPLNLEMHPGQILTITNNRFNGLERFFIQSVDHEIKKNDGRTTLNIFAHTLTDAPEDVVLSSTGIADLDIIVQDKKTVDSLIWNSFGGI